MFSGRTSSCPIILSIIRRAKSSENKCPRCILVPKQICSDKPAFAKVFCNQRFYSNHDREVLTKMAASAEADVRSPKHTNRLVDSKSPYLLQHAHNPVDWYPWGEEAFEKAQKEDKLIFLSVGYSTCHWCHVMERESFENEDIAKIMNEHFVNIKVDREERPDVDKVYMTFVQACSGSGGWPMSVFLKPDLKPVSGGTYYPPEDKYGRRGFKSELLKWVKEWKTNKAQWSKLGDSVTEVIRNATVFEVPMSENLISGVVPGAECWQLCMEQLSDHYEPTYGGFGLAPKFPQPGNLVFLFHAYARNPTDKKCSSLKDMGLHTLKMMARGGIHDHIAQGFARYSTDMKWHVPHFEKMLYDQAQLAVVYSTAYLITQDPLYQDVVKDILTYVGRDLSHKEGGFYSAEDADSLPTTKCKEKREGAFCVWTNQEICELLDRSVAANSSIKLAQLFSFYYNVKPSGNVDPSQVQVIKDKSVSLHRIDSIDDLNLQILQLTRGKEKDPHKELIGQNVLMIVKSEAQTAAQFGLDESTVRSELAIARQILYDERQKRPRPHLDDKILTSWNGLMISGYAKAGEALHNEEYIERAVRAAKFVKNYLYNSDTNTLLRSCYTAKDGSVAQISSPIEGFLDDYAFLIQGLLDLYESCLDAQWLEWAEQLQKRQDELFWDIGTAGYFSTPHQSDLILRLKEDQDGAEPGGNSVACQNLLRLGAMLDRAEYRDKASKLLASFTSRLNNVPISLPQLTSALMLHHDSPTLITITGKSDDTETAALLRVVRSRYIPGRVLLLADNNTSSIVYRSSETVQRMKPSEGHQSAYVCRHRTCSLPVHTPHDLAALLDTSSS
ncbi:spermatogenesis-associated protein 20 isoform X1 [Homalodisca vitripennis]|uniref:spermatogenesis-associated protein 20 isoform X1 n=2 Tax=Homalodisca vitripennis TaxID=197043 RepID=UPI001EEABD21|nr:spermatogenesis-associated protein 20 isoform X1 [Homalodisca vitripennis]